jgi:hypothetical protein
VLVRRIGSNRDEFVSLGVNNQQNFMSLLLYQVTQLLTVSDDEVRANAIKVSKRNNAFRLISHQMPMHTADRFWVVLNLIASTLVVLLELRWLLSSWRLKKAL